MICTRRFGMLLALGAALTAAGCGGGTSPTLPATVTRDTSAVARSGTGALRSYRIDPSKVFVAGISSGGFFAVQMHVAFSSTFKGAAVYAGGVYYCAQNSVAVALAACGGEGLYASTLVPSETYLDLQSSQGTIDPESNLRGQPVYLWSGTNDTVVSPHEMDDLQTEYRHYGANVVRYDNAYPAGHGWESPDGELSCGTQASPYIVSCNGANGRPYDSEQTWLQAFFGPLKPRNGGALDGTILNFDQTAFGASASNSMDTNGYVFVPRGCAAGKRCGLVVAFHGCLQTQADIGTKFVTESGLNPWADRNDVIVLYPFAIKSSTVPLNPNGCWDWWGYDDPNYALRSGTQMAIVDRMVRRLMGR